MTVDLEIKINNLQKQIFDMISILEKLTSEMSYIRGLAELNYKRCSKSE